MGLLHPPAGAARRHGAGEPAVRRGVAEGMAAGALHRRLGQERGGGSGGRGDAKGRGEPNDDGDAGPPGRQPGTPSLAGGYGRTRMGLRPHQPNRSGPHATGFASRDAPNENKPLTDGMAHARRGARSSLGAKGRPLET